MMSPGLLLPRHLLSRPRFDLDLSLDRCRDFLLDFARDSSCDFSLSVRDRSLSQIVIGKNFYRWRAPLFRLDIFLCLAFNCHSRSSRLVVIPHVFIIQYYKARWSGTIPWTSLFREERIDWRLIHSISCRIEESSATTPKSRTCVTLANLAGALKFYETKT